MNTAAATKRMPTNAETRKHQVVAAPVLRFHLYSFRPRSRALPLYSASSRALAAFTRSRYALRIASPPGLSMLTTSFGALRSSGTSFRISCNLLRAAAPTVVMMAFSATASPPKATLL
eukprot:3361073-Prymnesium_polylepis.1